MIEVFQRGDNFDQLVKAYKKKVDQTGMIKELKKKARHRKKSEIRKQQVKTAVLTQRYRQTHGLV